FQFTDRLGYRKTLEGLSHQFNKEYWNYAKLISSVLRHGMPIEYVVNLINSMTFDNESINNWKAGVARSLKKYIPDGTVVKHGQKCANCGNTTLIYQEGCLICTSCGNSKCG
ncbi:MAG: ribonucleoside-diphosphate reductase, adenosylcobalamin-dependent, partial [Bacteroidales bacterium]|nr:ribonucleoside-diphosphate reductase, adenosylcobalamin-dependent [Bacteroidales bacterium]